MKLVKIVWSTSGYNEYESTKHFIVDSIDNWEEISDEDYDFLLKNRYRILRKGELTPHVFVKDVEDIKDTLKSVKDLIEFDKAQQELIKEKNLQAKLRRKAKTKEDKLKLLESLKKELNVK